MTLDDATNWIYPALLVAEEGTLSSLLGSHETIAAHGLFGALYRPGVRCVLFNAARAAARRKGCRSGRRGHVGEAPR